MSQYRLRHFDWLACRTLGLQPRTGGIETADLRRSPRREILRAADVVPAQILRPFFLILSSLACRGTFAPSQVQAPIGPG